MLNMARAGADLAAAAVFHALLGPNTPAPAPGTVKKILILNGADDPFVKREQYEELGKKFNLPLRYDAKVNQEAEAEADKFFADDLKK